ncbi:MAG TPA: response regulator [Bacteroidota bacterium]|nr:response regulator [Bacteroidota bacterium]
MAKSIRNAQNRNVLIVEDSQDFSNLLKFIVEDDGFVGVQFPLDGSSVVDWAKQSKPAVILMDLTLRRKPGMDFIEELKAEKETKHIPIIIITGRELSPREIVGLQLRDIGYLRKGRVELDEIRAEIRKAAGLPARKAPPGKTNPA